jgi:hypothetical protein
MRLSPQVVPVTASLLVFLLVAPALAAKVDVVVLQNGTRIVGEVKSMSKAKLEVSTDDMGTLQIEWSKVKEVTAPEFFEVESMDGGLRFGSLRPGPGGGVLEVVADWGTDDLPLNRVARIQLVSTGFWSRFKGSIDVGASYTSASSLTQLSADGDLKYRRPKFQWSLNGEAVLTQQPDVQDTRRSSLAVAYARLFPNRQRIFAQGTLEQNRELGFDFRGSVVGGWGYILARDTRNELVGGTGLSVNREKPVEGETTTNLEAMASLNYANFAYDFPNTDIQVGASAYLGLSQWGRFRLESSASLRREVFKDFYFGLKGYESYDSRPATEGAQNNDWGLTITLGYSF